MRDFTTGYLVQEFENDLFYIPPYRRNFVWDGKRKCRFIESVFLGLPIPMMFVAETDDGRLKVVDGAQRIQTLEVFLNELVLENLKQLPALNGFRCSDIPETQR